MTGQIILLIVLIAMTAALTYCESSVASLSDSKIEKIIENSDKKSQNLKKLWKRREKFLTAAHSAVMLAALLSSALACHSFAKPLAELTAKKTDLFSEAFFGYLFAVLITVAAAVLVIASAIKTARVSLVISAVFAPMMWITKALAKVILKLIGIDPDKELNAVTEEEILMMSDEGAEKGTIDEDDNRIIKNIFAFDDLTADQVCTHEKTEMARTRKLLMHRKEIMRLIGKVERSGYALIPLDLHFVRGRVKLSLALARGKRDFEKRQDESKKEWKRDQERLMKNDMTKGRPRQNYKD